MIKVATASGATPRGALLSTLFTSEGWLADDGSCGRPLACSAAEVTASPIAVEVMAIDAGAVVVVTGEVDLLTADGLRDALCAAVVDHQLVVVDLSAVDFLSSSGLTSLALAHRAAVAAGHVMCVVATDRVVLRPIEITGLADRIRVFASVPDAVAGLGPADAPPVDR
jgi:anti-sigma B factor antagonist